MSYKGKKKLILSAKKSAKGVSLQGKMYVNGLAVTFFTQADENGNPKMYLAKDGTPLLIFSVHAFDNTMQDNVFGKNYGGWKNKKSDW